MILYHGSNVEVRNPDLNFSQKTRDFGAGFYTTTDLEQAKKWARNVVRMREDGVPTVSVFELEFDNQNVYNEENDDKDGVNSLSILEFKNADVEWLDFVVGYRTGQIVESNYDIITGPVANDRTVDIINQYIAGSFSQDIALQLLIPLKFKDQWVMKTEKAIKLLVFKEAMSV